MGVSCWALPRMKVRLSQGDEGRCIRPQRKKALDAKGLPLPVPAVAQNLCRIGQFTVPLGGRQIPLKVSPYMSGEIQKAEVSRKVGNGGWPSNLSAPLMLPWALPAPPSAPA